MACESFEKKISLFLDGELSEQEKQDIMAHLKTCAECAKAYASFQKIDSLYLETMPISPGPAFVDSVTRRVRGTGLPWWKIAAAVLIFVSGWLMGSWTERIRNKEKITPGTVQNAGSSRHFPYLVTMKENPQQCYIIENESDEKEWHEFLKSYIRQITKEEEKTKLNQYKVDHIPVQFLHSGDF